MFELIRQVAAVVLSDTNVEEPMVAFVCNRPAMHSSNRGWVRDETTSCIKDPIEILNYCRKVRHNNNLTTITCTVYMKTFHLFVDGCNLSL